MGQVLERQRAHEELFFQTHAIEEHALVSITNKKGEITYVNERFVDTSGYSREELIGQTHRLLRSGHHGPEFYDDLWGTISRGETWKSEICNRAKDGSFYWVESTILAGHDENGRIDRYIAVLTDISEIKDTEAELIRTLTEVETARDRVEAQAFALTTMTEDLTDARVKAERAVETRSQFLANMSREIRTPMNGVLGMAELLTDAGLTVEQRDYVTTIMSSGEILLALINDILDLSKLEAGRIELESRKLDLHDVMTEVLQLLRNSAHDKGVELILRYPLDVPHVLLADSVRIRQILTNLIANAIKFTAAGHVLLETQIESEEESGSPKLLVSVRDTGIGIDELAVAELFDAFSQADASTTRKYGGTGLGLAISKTLVELMGGEIGVDSEPGSGSTFWFTLPIPPDTTSTLGPPVSESLREVRVLMAAAGPAMRTTLRGYVDAFSMRAEEVSSAGEIVPALCEAAESGDPFGLLIFDNHESDMGTVALGNQIAASPALGDTRTVLLSLTSWRGNESKLSSAGWHLYLEPPVPPHRLFEALVAVVEKGSEEVGSAGLLTQRDLDEATLETTRSVVDEKILNDSRPPSHVLVAEDNRVNQKLVVRLLEKLGCTVDVAHDGREAVERLQKAEYDLVLMDCQMPEMDGYQATQAIRDRERDSGERIPIIALTANAMEGDRERCLDAGMDDYVTKPVSRKALDAVLAKWSDGA